MCIIAVALQRLLKTKPGVGCPQHMTPQVMILYYFTEVRPDILQHGLHPHTHLHQSVHAVASGSGCCWNSINLANGACNPCNCCRANASQANRLTHLCKQDCKETSIAQTAILIDDSSCKLAGVTRAAHYQSCSQTESTMQCKPHQICHSCVLIAKDPIPPQQAKQGCAMFMGPWPCCLHHQASTT